MELDAKNRAPPSSLPHPPLLHRPTKRRAERIMEVREADEAPTADDCSAMAASIISPVQESADTKEQLEARAHTIRYQVVRP